jgi:hypothetical protein
MRVFSSWPRRAFVPLAVGVAGGLVLLGGGALRADTTVQNRGGLLDVTANAAPLSEVLDRIAKQTGMKVVYDGPQPRALVTLRIEKATGAQAVLTALEGMGLGYVVRMDPTGTRVDTLMMITGRTAAGPARSGSSGVPAGFPPAEERVQLPEQVDEVDAVDDQPVINDGAPEPPQVPPGFPNTPFGGAPGQVMPGINPQGGNMPVLPGPLQPGMMPVPVPGMIQPGMIQPIQPGMIQPGMPLPPPGVPLPGPQTAPSPFPQQPNVPQ